MAEFCRKCFIESLYPSQEDIDLIVMSEDETMCEGCMNWGQYVDYLAPTKRIAEIRNKQIEEKRKNMRVN